MTKELPCKQCEDGTVELEENLEWWGRNRVLHVLEGECSDCDEELTFKTSYEKQK